MALSWPDYWLGYRTMTLHQLFKKYKNLSDRGLKVVAVSEVLADIQELQLTQKSRIVRKIRKLNHHRLKSVGSTGRLKPSKEFASRKFQCIATLMQDHSLTGLCPQTF